MKKLTNIRTKAFKIMRNPVMMKRLLHRIKNRLENKKNCPFNNLDQIPGGLGDNRPDSDFDPKQLAKGIEIEKEHTNDPEKAKEIAKDHLTEVPNYYIDTHGEDRLEKLEETARKELK